MEDLVRAQLDLIIDPCAAAAGAPAGLVEMGLVRSLAVRDTPDGAAVRVTIGVTEPGCLMGAAFAAQAREHLEAMNGVSEVAVELDHHADWAPSDLAPAYRLRLEEVRAARRRPAAFFPDIPHRTPTPPEPAA
ncbi:iron-sulfur cluster assembly protein [Streptantibioticus silvisoli]|uniref:Iron-sulfur cluster assembly protein n=1 Tax=Streptantibioticus silvisoli TaxID=2705255 RepID=A0ABT6W2I4_9ACTN|nr:iron-sulfur cluster assembly protein [Streptantibioticus silvisoli]MDI5964615.1 iron-sulfur cluster assembly protein [Streptantibioticus silvisoli]